MLRVGGAANGKDVAELRQGHAKPPFTFRALRPVQGARNS
jgi:hypothetical protein